MTNSFNEVSEQLKEIQQNLTQAVNIVKEVPTKLNQFLGEKKDLEELTEKLNQFNTDLKNQISTLEHKFSEEQAEFERKLESNENKIVSLQRELDLTKDDVIKLQAQLKSKDDRINILESQNKELTDSLRQQSQ
ncbi:MAG: hypothetical protein ACFFB2_01510 [Promethearchaeota archaeon]